MEASIIIACCIARIIRILEERPRQQRAWRSMQPYDAPGAWRSPRCFGRLPSFYHHMHHSLLQSYTRCSAFCSCFFAFSCCFANLSCLLMWLRLKESHKLGPTRSSANERVKKDPKTNVVKTNRKITTKMKAASSNLCHRETSFNTIYWPYYFWNALHYARRQVHWCCKLQPSLSPSLPPSRLRPLRYANICPFGPLPSFLPFPPSVPCLECNSIHRSLIK